MQKGAGATQLHLGPSGTKIPEGYETTCERALDPRVGSVHVVRSGLEIYRTTPLESRIESRDVRDGKG